MQYFIYYGSVSTQSIIETFNSWWNSYSCYVNIVYTHISSI